MVSHCICLSFFTRLRFLHGLIFYYDNTAIIPVVCQVKVKEQATTLPVEPTTPELPIFGKLAIIIMI